MILAQCCAFKPWHITHSEATFPGGTGILPVICGLDLLAYCNDGQDARPTEEGIASLLCNDTVDQISQEF
jgi:hypothetical protein